MKLSLLILGAIICLSFDYTNKHLEKKEINRDIENLKKEKNIDK